MPDNEGSLFLANALEIRCMIYELTLDLRSCCCTLRVLAPRFMYASPTETLGSTIYTWQHVLRFRRDSFLKISDSATLIVSKLS